MALRIGLMGKLSINGAWKKRGGQRETEAGRQRPGGGGQHLELRAVARQTAALPHVGRPQAILQSHREPSEGQGSSGWREASSSGASKAGQGPGSAQRREGALFLSPAPEPGQGGKRAEQHPKELSKKNFLQ